MSVGNIDIGIFRGRVEQARYIDQIIPSYRGNPLIEALPPILDEQTAVDSLTFLPAFEPAARKLAKEYRLHFVEDARFFIQPTPVHLDIEQRFSRMLRSGYRLRNPCSSSWNSQIEAGVAIFQKAKALIGPTPSSALGFSFLGMSGIGKTTAINSVLNLYPQRIDHDLNKTGEVDRQIVWLKLTCPHDGSVKGLCVQFFKTIDAILETNYGDLYLRNGKSADSLLPDVANIAARHALGVLVIDEIHFLSAAASGGERKMLQFFTNLINVLGLPVVLVGTYKAAALLKKSFSDARRGTGQGDLIWNPMAYDEVWTLFVDSLWNYQYTRNESPLTDSLKQVLFDLSQGITDIAVKIYMLSQHRAILTGIESVTEDIMRSVAIDSLRLPFDALDALRRRDWKALSTYDDLLMIDWEGEIRRDYELSADAKSAQPFEPSPLKPSSPKLDETLTSGAPQTSSPVRRRAARISKKDASPSSLMGIVDGGAASGISPYSALKAAGLIGTL